jgi:rubrerythrin
MNIQLIDLIISFKKSHERIIFEDFNYFYGQMGAGKSTIARLIDYCLGGDLSEAEMTPALQTEFVSASLSLKVENILLVLERDVSVTKVLARWSIEEQHFEVLIPARSASGEILPNTGVEVLSDLIYHLAGKTPPKVRRSKIKEDSELERLSLRDLLWYCYLDQDSMDSNFFNLDSGAHIWKRLKSRDVLRFLVGFHQEHVAELEAQLERARSERLKCDAGVNAIQDALSSAEIATKGEIGAMRDELESKLQKTDAEITNVRDRTQSLRTHAMEILQDQARHLAYTIDELKDANHDIRDSIKKDKAHKNELLELSTRHRRSQAAREILSGVDFKDCPRCGNTLQTRTADVCPICGQVHSDMSDSAFDEKAAEQDLKLRVDELTEIITMHESNLLTIQRQFRETKNEKDVVDGELTRISVEYDSVYLSSVLETEKRRSSLQQQLIDLYKLEVLVQKIDDLSNRAIALLAEEKNIKSTLKKARESAEKDTKNLKRLKVLFLDCLLRAKIPGFFSDDDVEMKSPHFLPEIASAGSGDLAITSFTNLGSGGKKTLFKCCFAVAVHRFAVEIGAMLPTFMIIDSPMKNISERENRIQFEGFFEMLYDLCNSELQGTQFILIDKELCVPPEDFRPSFKERHMTPNDDANPPLISYYRGK